MNPYAVTPPGALSTQQSLGALSWIAPGEKVVHEERLKLHDGLCQLFIPPSLRQRLEAT
jgi:hypothetical protein